MNNAYVATAVAIRDLNCYSLETIDDRILLQKKIYLAQDIGVPLGYGFSWYIHGPYSPDLTAVAYQIIPEGNEAIEGMSLKEPYLSMINKVNSLESIASKKDLRINLVQWFELLASIAYWNKRGCNTKDEIVERIHETKPHFSEKQTEEAYDAYIAFKK